MKPRRQLDVPRYGPDTYAPTSYPQYLPSPQSHHHEHTHSPPSSASGSNGQTHNLPSTSRSSGSARGASKHRVLDEHGLPLLFPLQLASTCSSINDQGQCLLQPCCPGGPPAFVFSAQPSAKPPVRPTKDRQSAKLYGLQRQLEDKLEEYTLLVEQNKHLRLRSRVLEQVVSIRDEQLQLLRSHLPLVTAAPDTTAHLNAPMYRLPAHAPGDSSGGGGDDRDAAGAAAGGSHAGGGSIVDSPTGCCAAIGCSFRAMTPEQFRELWATFVRDAGSILMEAEVADPDPRVIQRLSELVTGMMHVIMQLSLLNPLVIYTLQCLNIERNEPEQGRHGHWRQVVGQLGLAEQQRKDIHMTYQLYADRLAQVLCERTEISTMMHGSDVPHDGNFISRAQQYVLVERLTSSLVKEHAVRGILMTLLKLLTTLQFAKLAVFSWPYFPFAPGMEEVLLADIVD